jgi:PAS domain S-box-containing protein
LHFDCIKIHEDWVPGVPELNSFDIRVILTLAVRPFRPAFCRRAGYAVQASIMTRRLRFDYHSLPVQMVLGFVALAFLTALAIGVPAIWLIRTELNQQAWSQVEQGRQATQSVFSFRQSEVTQLAILTAQRPTLKELLAAQDWTGLPDYLDGLRSSSALGLVAVCNGDGQSLQPPGRWAGDPLCTGHAFSGFGVTRTLSGTRVWLVAVQPIKDVSGADAKPFFVMTGIALDDAFATQMRDQTKLEQTLWAAGEPVASSLVERITTPVPCSASDSLPGGGDCRVTFQRDGTPFYAIRTPLVAGEPTAQPVDLEMEVALSVGDILVTQTRLVWLLVGGMLFVASTGSLAGVFLARRISRPLARVAGAAAGLSKGDLASPIAVHTGVREVAQVAQALERARADLEQTLEHLRQEKAWTDHLLEAIVEGIVTLDRYGRITFFSQGAEHITGWRREEVLNRSCDHIFKVGETVEPFSQLIPPPGRRKKIPVQLPDGRQVILAVTGAALLPPESGAARVALVFRDISEEEAVHRLLGHFLANVAHEFRTPLAAVAASTELLLDQATDLSVAELGELLASLHLGVLGLQTLVDNLLEGASIEAGRFRVSPRNWDLSEIIAEAIRTTQPLLAKRGQQLAVELPAAIPVVLADPRRIVQVLVNLLSNASKYGPDEAEVSISASSQAGHVWIGVADRGPGIPRDERQNIFHRFTHLDGGNDRAQYGAGLGLSVVKAIVEAHGGEIGVEDRPGGGSVFWFTLPKADKI